MAYTTGKPYEYGIPDGTYAGRPTTASCYEKDGRLMLDVRFAVKDPATGEWFRKDNGYEWEIMKRHWLTSQDGGFNEATINGLKEWANGWNPQSFEDFYWFQSPDANGTPFGNLAAVGEVELNFTHDRNGNQTVFVHDPSRPRAAGRKAYVPDGATSDAATLAAKWGARAKALFASTPKKVAAIAQAAPKTPATPSAAPAGVSATPTAPARPAGVPARPAAKTEADPDGWDRFPHTCDGAFQYFCSTLGEEYSSAKHDAAWFAAFDAAANGKDPDQFEEADAKRLFAEIANANMLF